MSDYTGNPRTAAEVNIPMEERERNLRMDIAIEALKFRTRTEPAPLTPKDAVACWAFADAWISETRKRYALKKDA